MRTYERVECTVIVFYGTDVVRASDEDGAWTDIY